MPGGTNIDDGPIGPVINELLCFIINKWGNIDVDVLMRLCLGNYNDKQIEEAKDLLFRFLHDESDHTEYKKRRACSKPTGKSKNERNLEDIFKILEEKGDVEIPDFVALDLGNLPPITYDSIDVSVLLRKADNLECTVKFLKDAVNSVTDSYKGLCEVFDKLNSKVCGLEATNKEYKSALEKDSPEQCVTDCEKVIDVIVDELRYVCSVCDIRFMTELCLLAHRRKEHSDLRERTCSCSECEQKCDTQEDLTTHISTHSTFVCSICEKRFSPMHMNAHTGDKPYTCEVCDYEGNSKLSLNTHMEVHKSEFAQFELEKQMQSLSITGERPFQCDKCDFRDPYEENLKLHMESHRGEKQFKCDKCPYRYYNKDNLMMHMNTHTGERTFNCDKCEFSHTNNENLKLHMEMHKEVKTFNCDQCDFSHFNKENLMRHMEIHTGEELFKCDKCDYSHANKENLKMHMDVHKSEMPNIDSDVAFPQLGSNTSEPNNLKLYVCHVCNDRFSTKSECKTHTQMHKSGVKEKLNACYLCDSKYATVAELKKHILTHTEEKPFRCNECDYVCDDDDTLKHHMVVHTSKKVITEKNKMLTMDDIAKQHLIEALFDNDGWSLPFYKGKPIKPKDILKQNHPMHQNRNIDTAIIGTGRGASQAIESEKDQAILFASRFKPSSNATIVKKDLESNLLRVTGVRHIVTVEKRPTKYDHYASYKISSFCNDKSVFLNPEVWPSGIIVRWWRHQRNATNNRQDYNKNNYRYNRNRSQSITGHGY